MNQKLLHKDENNQWCAGTREEPRGRLRLQSKRMGARVEMLDQIVAQLSQIFGREVNVRNLQFERIVDTDKEPEDSDYKNIVSIRAAT